MSNERQVIRYQMIDTHSERTRNVEFTGVVWRFTKVWGEGASHLRFHVSDENLHREHAILLRVTFEHKSGQGWRMRVSDCNDQLGRYILHGLYNRKNQGAYMDIDVFETNFSTERDGDIWVINKDMLDMSWLRFVEPIEFVEACVENNVLELSARELIALHAAVNSWAPRESGF